MSNGGGMQYATGGLAIWTRSGKIIIQTLKF